MSFVTGTVRPSLSGNFVTYLTLGIAPNGKSDVTNLEPVTFQ